METSVIKRVPWNRRLEWIKLGCINSIYSHKFEVTFLVSSGIQWQPTSSWPRHRKRQSYFVNNYSCYSRPLMPSSAIFLPANMYLILLSLDSCWYLFFVARRALSFSLPRLYIWILKKLVQSNTLFLNSTSLIQHPFPKSNKLNPAPFS